MAGKGVLMACVAVISGAWMGGCMRTASVPPAMSRLPAPRPMVPNTTRTTPPSGDDFHLPPTLSLRTNPWKPKTAPRDWKYIVLHHTASSSGSVESIHATHLKRTDKDGNRWMGIGYHFVIGNGNGMADGAVEPTFRWQQQLPGAHAGVGDYNDQGIGITLVGNFDEQPPSRAQLAAVKRLVSVLKANYRITGDNVIGHGDIKATACPGKYFPMTEVSRSVDFYLRGTTTENSKQRTSTDDSTFLAELLAGTESQRPQPPARGELRRVAE